MSWFNLNKRKIVDFLMCSVCHSILLVLSVFLFSPVKTKAQTPIISEKKDTTSFDQLPVTVYIDYDLSIEIDFLISGSDKMYLNIEELFRKLQVPCTKDNSTHQLTGAMGNEKANYIIDYATHQISAYNKTINDSNGLIEELGYMYIELSLLDAAFGLKVTFNQRSLSAKLVSSYELPFIKQIRIENSRQKSSKMKEGEVIPDTIIHRDYHLFRFGTLDWAINSVQNTNQPVYNFMSLGVGTEILYGQANISINYNSQSKFDQRQLRYGWHWVDNDKYIVKQAHLGIIQSQAIASVFSPVIGASASNASTTLRKASGYYNLSDYTEPNWTVELYINDVLTDYTTTDASGFYVFKVPIVYGYSILKLKFYSPLGEERTEERILNIPFTFLSPNKLEYNLLGGFLQADNESRYGLANFNYGVTRFLTVGGGAEYLSSIPNHPLIPFAKIAIQPFSKMVLNIEYAHDVRMKGLLNFYFTQNAFLELNYEKYKEGQLATRFKALEERKVKVTVPIKINKISLFTKYSFSQFIFKSFNYNQFDFVLSAYYKQFSANSALLINRVSENDPYMTTNLSISYRLQNGYVLRPSAEYNIGNKSIVRYRAEIEKRIKKIYLSAFYEKNVVSNTNFAVLSLRYDLPFARMGLSTSISNNSVSFSESAQGSIAIGGDNNYINYNHNSAIGKGGILFYPFLDINQNGTQDKGEQRILLSTVKITGGRAKISDRDSIVRISDLNAFVNYNIEFSDYDLDNIAWRFKHKTYQVLVDPNQYKRIQVPIVPVGEVNGIVYLKVDSTLQGIGIGRITIQIFDCEGHMIAETLSESDGYFNYLGLKPGCYTIMVDPQQLESLNYRSSPVFYKGAIRVTEDGDVVNNLDFHINSR